MKKYFVMAVMLAMAVCVQAKYNVGDIYDKDGVKGVVAYVDNTGEHGLLLSPEFCAKKWLDRDEKDSKFETGAFYEDDGQKNMDALAQYISSNGKNWDMFPLFQWAKSLGEGWFIPSKDELMNIWKSINGGTTKYNQKAFKKFGKALEKAKGNDLIDDGFNATMMPYTMLSSTESEGGMVYGVLLEQSAASMLVSSRFIPVKGTIKSRTFSKTHTGGKAGLFRSRAVHKF